MVHLEMVMNSFQRKLLIDIESGGIKPGEMMIISAGRGTGKSTFNAMYGKLWNDIMDKPLVMRWQQLPGRKVKAHITDTSRGLRDADMDEVQKWIWTNIPTAKRLSFDMWLFKEDKHITMFLMKWS